MISEEEEAAIFGPNAQERGEAETDSDPIVESDTTEHSGDDDGVSWPSDDDEPEAPDQKIAKTEKTKLAGKLKSDMDRTSEDIKSNGGHTAGQSIALSHIVSSLMR